ncbi:MAG: decarboxylating 6-phosphogluconate dehydrogenase [Candidatus Marsarchaeota archaeon]|nr:decarboxylating 6-phosphogluconate dehydrogenase [Candidatus Marsarchaeota archaeon]
MEIAVVGLGRMGANIARRLARGGHTVFVHNRTKEKAFELASEQPGVKAASSLGELAEMMHPPRAVWVMVPAGEPTEQMIDSLIQVLSKGDTIIDGGNSFYGDTLRRSAKVESAGLNFVDVGTSGGIWGLEEGYSMMVGGRKEVVEALTPVFQTLAPAPDKGWGWMGPAGSGHFVKMVHNGIEYGMMESLAEGFDVLRSKQEFNLDLHKVAEVWRYGSVVRSWLLDLLSDALSKDQELKQIAPWVEDSGEGRWTSKEAIDNSVPAPVITLALYMRFASRRESYAAKLLAAMRNEFGGHAVKHVDEGT